MVSRRRARPECPSRERRQLRMMWILALSLFQFLISFSHLNFLVPLEAISETINSNSINDDILSQLSCLWSFWRSHPIRSREQRQMPWMWIVDLSCFHFNLLFLFKSVKSQTLVHFCGQKLHRFPSKKEKPFICSQ